MNPKVESDRGDADISGSRELPNQRSGFPIKSLIWTVVAILSAGLMHWQSFYLNEAFGLDMAIPNLVTYLLVLITIIVWGTWAFFFKRNWLLGATIIVPIILFFVLFYLDFGPDANIVAVKPRFWTWDTVQYAEVETEQGTDDQTRPASLQIKATSYDFPQFLGKQRDLVVDNVNLSSDWSTPPAQLWTMDVGNAWSGFVVVDGLAVTQEQRGEEECVTCYDAVSGELLWIHRAKRRHEDKMAMGKVGPRATPTIDGNLVYAQGATGVLDCLNLSDGTLVWTKDIPELVGIQQNPNTNSMSQTYTLESSALAWGRSCSPLIDGQLVIIPAGGPNQLDPDQPDPSATLIAFDKLSGAEVWRGGKRMIAYGSPNVITVDGTRMITLVGQKYAVGHDAKTGQELWVHERPGSSDGDANCSQVTLVEDNRVIVSKGYGMGGELLALENDAQGNWSARTIKKNPRVLRTKFTNPVVIDGYAYSLSDGFLECTEITNNSLNRKWRQRGRYGNGQLLAVGDKLLVHSDDGVLSLVEANPDEFVELGKINTVDGFCWNNLCLYGDLLLLRSDIQAACFRLPLEGEPIEATQSARKR